MNYFILSLFVVYAAACNYYEPDELECLCNGCGDPAVISYDGRAKMILDAQKTLLSRWDADPCDICKFQVRVVTKDDIGGSASDLHCDWIGFAIGVHSVNSDKFDKNFVFANDLDGKGVVAIRGHGYPGPNLLELDTPYVYCQDCCSWQITKVDDHKFTLRSDCCPYALDWLPDGVNTHWQLWVSDGSKYKDETMEGMCGNCNDEPLDDWVPCFDPDTILPMTQASLDSISDSCKEGDHDGQVPQGGMRLDGLSPP